MEIIESKVMIPGPVLLGATVCSFAEKGQKQRHPAIVLIMGTGKSDRDGNGKGFHTDFYKNLARFFVRSGFVSIRYDKRGTFQSEGNNKTAGLNDLVQDAIEVIHYARSLRQVDTEKIVVCGHSEGAMIATRLCVKEPTAGLMLLGGAATSMKDALFYQNAIADRQIQNMKGILGWILKKQAKTEKMNDKVEAMFKRCLETDKERIFFQGAWLNARWIKEHAELSSDDYVSLLKRYHHPVLAITGTADLSVDYHQLEQLENMEHVSLWTPQHVNHILRKVDDDNSVLTVKKQYIRLSGQPIDPATERIIHTWLKQFLQK